jgi:3-deoxy-manno-octulosonate cytidylyltransferase (CMP-KDO synthetase)
MPWFKDKSQHKGDSFVEIEKMSLVLRNTIGIIPARMASSRFPGKPLAKIQGIPMIGHVYFRSKMCESLNEVYVATCDEEIYDYITSIGGKAIMTSDTHQRASDRAAEALQKVEKEIGEKVDIVVMIQGDEPMLTPDMINDAVKPFVNDSATIVVNLMALLKTEEEAVDPNEVKVVTALNGNALYFSREPLPSSKLASAKVPVFKQVCIIPFRRDFLLKFNELPPTPLEVIESIDMLRLLEHGYNVKMVESKYDTYSVDTQEDLNKVEQLMNGDLLMKTYKS